jgi:hypothetical protein
VGTTARRTKLSDGIERATGYPSSQVQGWLNRGYGPDYPCELADHCRALGPFMGEGRDADVAVLQMAAQDRPCRCLRKVVRGLADAFAAKLDMRYVDTADEVVDVLRTVHGLPMLDDWTLAAESIEPPVEWDAACEPYVVAERWNERQGRPVKTSPETTHDDPIEREVNEVLHGAALLPIVQSYAGEPLEPGDTADLDAVVRHAMSQRGLGWAADVEDPELNLALLLAAQAAAPVSHAEWLDKATPMELTQAVRAADALESIFRYPGAPRLSHEERWRRVGLFAISVGPICPLLSRLVDVVVNQRGLPDDALSDNERRLFAALRTAARPVLDRGTPDPGDVQSG